jgi:hypothetical protein
MKTTTTLRGLALLPCLLAASITPSLAQMQSVALDFESDWADLAPNTFVQLTTLNPMPGGLRWGAGWFGQTTSPLQGSNNELRLGAGSFAVDNFGQPFVLDSVDFRSMVNGGSIRFDFVVTRYDAKLPGNAGASVLYNMLVNGAPDVVLPPLTFTTFSDTASLGPLLSFTFGNFQGAGEGTDRNLFVMDNLHLQLPAAPVPEPAMPSLLALGLAMTLWAGRRHPAQRE